MFIRKTVLMKIITWLFLFVSTFTYSQSKRYPSLLWKVTGKDLKKPSYLYGTMHVSNRVAYYLSEQFFDALKGVDVVGLETNPGEWLENMEKTGELAELTQVRDQGMNRNFYKSAFAAAFPDKRVFQGILSYDPDIINGLLYRQNKSRENFEESTYIDLFIYQSASKLNKKIISLEDFASSEIKARLSALPDEGESEDQPGFAGYGNAQKIEDAYREGNLDVIDSLSKLSSSKNTQKYLIEDRNVFFVNTIDSVLKTSSLFSGVGAAHLPGEKGVIELLRQRGYKVEAVEPSVSKKSSQQREELDQQFRPVTMGTQFAHDSLFSVSLPGKLYPILQSGQLKYFIHADMANGSFYTVVRLKHLGPLFNVNAQQVKAKIDSLLFEHIPGKILQKEEITANNGIKGIEVLNRTRNGDEQHYQIFFTDQEMIMFKLGGKHSYASGDVAKQFFSSIKFADPRPGTSLFTPPTGGFTTQVTGNYHYEKNEQVGVAGLVEDLFSYKDGQVRGVKHAVYNDFAYLEEDTFELNQLAGNVLDIYNYIEEINLKPAKEQGLPGITFTGKNKAGRWFGGKIIIKGVHYYMVYQASPSQIKFDDAIFTSFRLGEFRYVHPIRQVTDKEVGFKAFDEVTDDARSRFNEAYAKAYEKTIQKKDSAGHDYDYRAGSKYYYSPSSNEYVSITYEKYNDYDYRDPKTISDRLEKSFRANTTMFLCKKHFLHKNGIREFRYTLCDTATTRAIAVKVFYHKRTMHEVSVPYDTLIGLQGWALKFFESFTPFDSLPGSDLFENRFPELIKDLSGGDTTKRRAATNSLQNGLGLQEAFAPAFIKMLSDANLSKINEDSRAQLFVNGGTMGDEGIIAPYKKLYEQYTDSFYLQLCLLKGLAYLQTPASYKAFQELMVKEPPLVGDESSINDVFAVLKDSLELCKPFFPALLNLTRYEEFRNPVYTLLADLVDKKLISPTKYAKQKDIILTDASLALKRFNPANMRAEQDEGSFSHLDKTTREIAENIRKSLDGLANNMLYEGTPQLAQMGPRQRPALVSYAFILAPYYTKDENTREFFKRLSKIRAQDIILPVTVNLLRNNVTLSDSIVRNYSGDALTRAYFFSELEKNDIQEKFDNRYLSQEKLVESLISSQKQLNSYYGYEKEKSKRDSISLIKVLHAFNKYQDGKLYVYRNGKTRGEEQWSAVFVNGESDKPTSRMEILSTAYQVDQNKTEQQNLDDLLSYFRLSYRKRALVTAGN
jgi:uncharacterized protein YbaP (TraB family)